MVNGELVIPASFEPGTIITRGRRRFRAVAVGEKGTIFTEVRRGARVRGLVSREREDVLERARRARVSTLLRKAGGDIEKLPEAERIELQRLQVRVPPRAERREIIRRGEAPLSPQRRILEEQRRNLEREIGARESEAMRLQSKQAGLESRREKLQRLANVGTLQEGVAAKFRNEIRDLEKQIDAFNKAQGRTESRVGEFEEARQDFNREQQRRKVAGETVTTKVGEISGAVLARAPTKRELIEKRIIPLETVVPTPKQFKKKVVETGKAFEESITPFSALSLRAAKVTGAAKVAGFAFAGFSEFFETVFRGIGFVTETGIRGFERITGEPLSFKVTVPKKTAELIKGFEDIPILGQPFVGVGVTKKDKERFELAFGKPQAISLVQTAAELELLTGFAGTRAAAKGIRAFQKARFVSREPFFFPTVKTKPLTRVQRQQLFVGAITEPTKPPSFPLTFRIGDTSFTGLKRVKTIRAPRLDTAGLIPVKLPKRRAPRLEEAGLVFARARRPKVFRQKPLPFFEQVAPRKRVITITKPRRARVRKPRRVAGFEVSTEAIFPTTQRFGRRAFRTFEVEEVARPFARFVPKEIRVPKQVQLARAEAVSLLTGVSERVGVRTGERVLSLQKTRLKELEKLREREVLKQIAAERNALREFQRARTGLKTTLLFRTGLLEREALITRPLEEQVKRITRPRPRLRVPKAPRARARPFPFIPTFGITERKRPAPIGAMVPGFNAFVKKRLAKKKLFRKVTRTPQPKQVALARGASVTDRTISQTFKVRKAKKQVPQRAAPMFNALGKFDFKPKRKIYIERRGHAIDTLGEINELSVARFLQEEKRGLFGVQPRRKKKKKSGVSRSNRRGARGSRPRFFLGF